MCSSTQVHLFPTIPQHVAAIPCCSDYLSKAGNRCDQVLNITFCRKASMQKRFGKLLWLEHVPAFLEDHYNACYTTHKNILVPPVHLCLLEPAVGGYLSHSLLPP
jgi:hypothetical protein